RIATRHPERFPSLLAFGVTLSLVLQGAVNMLVVLGCLPTKGLTLPFLSYGGSAMIAALAQVGVLVALAREVEEGVTGDRPSARGARGRAKRAGNRGGAPSK